MKNTPDLCAPAAGGAPATRPTDRRLLRLLFVNAVIGILAGWVMLAAILCFNVAGLRELIAGSPSGLLAAIMLAVVFAFTFGSASMGTAVFLLPKEDTPGAGGGRRRTAPPRVLQPALAAAPSGPRRARR